jgi:hypothetical protein
MRADDGVRSALDRHVGRHPPPGEQDALRYLSDVGTERARDRPVHHYEARVNQHRVLVEQAHAGERLRLDVADARRDIIVEPARGQLGQELRKELEVKGDAERGKLDIDRADLLKSDHVRSGAGDLVGDRGGPRGEVGLPEGGDGIGQCGLIVGRVR